MVKYWQKLILMSIFCQFSSLTSSIYWQIQYKTKKLNTNIFWKPYVRFPSHKNYIDQCTQSDMMNLFKWSYSQFLFSWNIVSNLLKGALDKYDIYLFISNSIEDFKLDLYWNFQLIEFSFWTASSSECTIGYCIVYLLKLTLKNRKCQKYSYFFSKVSQSRR